MMTIETKRIPKIHNWTDEKYKDKHIRPPMPQFEHKHPETKKYKQKMNRRTRQGLVDKKFG